MGFRRIGAILLILVGLLAMFKKLFLWIFLIALILIVLFFIIRWLADLYWWGKDKGKWQ